MKELGFVLQSELPSFSAPRGKNTRARRQKPLSVNCNMNFVIAARGKNSLPRIGEFYCTRELPFVSARVQQPAEQADLSQFPLDRLLTDYCRPQKSFFDSPTFQGMTPPGRAIVKAVVCSFARLKQQACRKMNFLQPDQRELLCRTACSEDSRASGPGRRSILLTVPEIFQQKLAWQRRRAGNLALLAQERDVAMLAALKYENGIADLSFPVLLMLRKCCVVAIQNAKLRNVQ